MLTASQRSPVLLILTKLFLEQLIKVNILSRPNINNPAERIRGNSGTAGEEEICDFNL